MAFKKHKYMAKRTNGFPSRLESSLYDYLLLKQRDGKIKNIKQQQGVDLVGGIRWKIDFSYELVSTGELIYAEAKGVETQDYKIKLKLFKSDAKNVLEIYGGRYIKRGGQSIVVPILKERVEKKNV